MPPGFQNPPPFRNPLGRHRSHCQPIVVNFAYVFQQPTPVARQQYSRSQGRVGKAGLVSLLSPPTGPTSSTAPTPTALPEETLEALCVWEERPAGAQAVR